MDLYSLIGFTAASALVSLSIRSYNSEIGRQTAFASALFASLSILTVFTGIMEELRSLSSLGGIGSQTFELVLKAVGIAYLTRVASSICNDSGESTLAEIASICGRLMLVLIALPVVKRLLNLIVELINSGI